MVRVDELFEQIGQHYRQQGGQLVVSMLAEISEDPQMAEQVQQVCQDASMAGPTVFAGGNLSQHRDVLRNGKAEPCSWNVFRLWNLFRFKRRFLFTSGCNASPQTPYENVIHLPDAAWKLGRRTTIASCPRWTILTGDTFQMDTI